MTRTQIQLPDPLYAEIKRIAQEQDWSIAEVLCRGAEAILRVYPSHKKQKSTWKLPAPLKMKLLIDDPDRIKDAIFNDSQPNF